MPPPEPSIKVDFDAVERLYAPSSAVTIRYSIDGLASAELTAVERSVLWYTEGKGEEDLGVHFFDRLVSKSVPREQLEAGSFSVVLPASPLSYEGVIVKIRWCVRVRVFFDARAAGGDRVAGARDFVSEHVFEVGTIPPAVIAAGNQSA